MSGTQVTVVTAIGPAAGPVETAAIEAMRESQESAESVPVLIEVSPTRRRHATVFATAAAKDLETLLEELVPGCHPVVRGALCLIQAEDVELALAVVEAIADLGRDCRPVIAVPSGSYRQLVEELPPVERILFRADSSPEPEDGSPLASTGDPLLELALEEAERLADGVQVVRDRPGRLASRRALAGSASGATRPRQGRHRRRNQIAEESGQATPLVLGAVFALVVGAVVAVAIAGAITGKGQAQRAADLAALSAARSMKDDLPRLLAPPTLPNGLPNPEHMPKPVYLARAQFTALRIVTANGASPLTASVRFPDALSYAPVRARVTIRIRADGSAADPVWAEARIGASLTMGAVPHIASGGGYSGSLAERLGIGMRPDVAEAFDRMAAAASAAGVALAINSGFRSDAEQAALFAANPDPRMVAPPGTSLHRCGTELDLGPSSAYGWLAANAGRFGFVQRYSWEAWHYGFTAGPEPCSAAGNQTGTADRSQSLPASVPSFVPARYRAPILSAAMKWGVSGALLAAQLLAESGFDPNAGSSAGAQGIAQFMPATAAAYGLANPFDPVRAIDAQAHLMSDLLEQFGSPALALAAYNAGPGAVGSCDLHPALPGNPGLRRPHPGPGWKRRLGPAPADGDRAGRLSRVRDMDRLEISGPDSIDGLIGRSVGPTGWREVTQEMVNDFAELTGDHQWIHVDVERAKAESPFGTTIAHGNLTLSMIDGFRDQLIAVTGGFRLGVNYGWDRVRFPAPVPVGSKLRASAELIASENLGNGWFHNVTRFTVEIEGGEKPVCVADSVGRLLAG